MQRPKSLQLTLPSATTATASAASPGIEAMEENEPVTSPVKADGNGGSNGGEHGRTPTNDITNIAAAFPASETPASTQPTTQPQLTAPLLLLPPPPPPLQSPSSQSRRPARPSSLLLVTPAGQWAPPTQQPSSTSVTAAVASPSTAASATSRPPQSRRPTSLCLPSRLTLAADSCGPQAQPAATPVTPTPTLPSPSPLGLRRPSPFPDLPPAVKRLRPSSSGGSSGLAFGAFPPAANFHSPAVAATPSSELPPSPFPPPTPSSTLTLSSSSSPSIEHAAMAAVASANSETAAAAVEDAEMASPTASTASSSVSATFQLGFNKPYWVPDRDAPLCMQCGVRFTIMRRRHHCRACGRVLCSGCACHSARLAFLGGAKARVCAACNQQLTLPPPPPPPPLPPSLPQPQPQRLPGGLKLTSTQQQQQLQTAPQPPRSVVFSDGVRPGSDFPAPDASPSKSTDSAGLELSLAPLDGSELPPLCRGLSTEVAINDEAAAAALSSGRTLMYQVCRSVRVSARLLQSLPCCTVAGTSWWMLLSRGLFTVGQSEVFLLLQRATGESLPPAHAFALVYSVYERAYSGGWLRHLDYLPAPRRLGPLLGDRSHAGLLLFRPSRLHCTLHLGLPAAAAQPPLCGLLVLRWEAPWAELFPMRLLLRLGCELRVYPCPLTSIRQRAPVFVELGRSLAGLLVDTKNFSHGLPCPAGLSVRLRTGCTTVRCPADAYDSVQKALAAATAGAAGSAAGGGWVLAFGASFCPAADAHLVCHQNLETGEYGTRAISIEGRQLSVTAASFIVFNGGGGAFGHNRASIVEDGVLVQLTDDQMARLRDSLRSMRPWSAVCSAADSAGDLVEFVWISRQDAEEQKAATVAVAAAATEAGEFGNADWWVSLVDGQSLTGCRTVQLTPAGQRLVRCTRLHCLREGDLSDGSPADCLRWANRLSGAVALAVGQDVEANMGDADYPEDEAEEDSADGCSRWCPRQFAIRVRAGIANVAAAWSGSRRLPPGLQRSLESNLRPLLNELDRQLATELALELVFARLPTPQRQ